MAECQTPIGDETLLDYWARDEAAGGEVDRIEEHLFACAGCSDRLQQLAALGTGMAALARQGRMSGIVSRALLNRLQRDGVRLRMFSLMPGETVPCAVFPGDDLVVAALGADLSGVSAVTLSVTAPDHTPFAHFDDVPVFGPAGEVCWVTPAAVVQAMSSMRLDITLSAAGGTGAELGRYALEHRAMTQD